MTTDELMESLSDENCSLDDYFSDNDDSFVNEDIKEFWENLIAKNGRSKSNIINKSDFSYCYFYDIINGRKMPTKDKVVRLSLAMNLTLEECQKALKISGRSALYPRVRRDSIIIYALENQLTIFRCDELLKKYGEECLK